MGCENIAACGCTQCSYSAGVAAAQTGAGASILDRIAGAVDAAIHGDGSASGGSNNVLAFPVSLSRSNVIPFPMVNAYRPLLRTRVPVAGLNAFPKVNDIVNVGYRVDVFNRSSNRSEDRDEEGFAGFFDNVAFGPPADSYPQGVSLPSSQSGSGTLQSILDAISRTLPATISAIRKSPYENAYYDPSKAGTVAQQPQTLQPQSNIPPGWHRNSSGELVKDAVSNVTDFITENPLLVGGAVLGVVLLFMQSPSRRR